MSKEPSHIIYQFAAPSLLTGVLDALQLPSKERREALSKDEFQGFSYPIEEGTYFIITVYKRTGQAGTTASAWPLAQFWHTSLRDLPDAE